MVKQNAKRRAKSGKIAQQRAKADHENQIQYVLYEDVNVQLQQNVKQTNCRDIKIHDLIANLHVHYENDPGRET